MSKLEWRQAKIGKHSVVDLSEVSEATMDRWLEEAGQLSEFVRRMEARIKNDQDKTRSK